MKLKRMAVTDFVLIAAGIINIIQNKVIKFLNLLIVETQNKPQRRFYNIFEACFGSSYEVKC